MSSRIDLDAFEREMAKITDDVIASSGDSEMHAAIRQVVRGFVSECRSSRARIEAAENHIHAVREMIEAAETVRLFQNPCVVRTFEDENLAHDRADRAAKRANETRDAWYAVAPDVRERDEEALRRVDGAAVAASTIPSSPDDLRRAGWAVAVHRDSTFDGRPHVSWLLTKGDRCVRGGGRTDAEALDQIRATIRTSLSRHVVDFVDVQKDGSIPLEGDSDRLLLTDGEIEVEAGRIDSMHVVPDWSTKRRCKP